MMFTQDYGVLKEIPGYKALLKAVIKSQMQMLVEQLSSETDEESVILTASTSDGSLCQLGSTSGKDFLEGRDEIKSQFLSHCLQKISNNSFGEEKPSKRRRYSDEESSSFHSPHIDIPLDTGSEPQHSTSSYSTGNRHASTTEVWEPKEPVRPVKLVTYKKRFKSTPVNRGKVSEPLNRVPKVTPSSYTKVIEPMPSSITNSVSIKTEHEGVDIAADSVHGNEITETVSASDTTNNTVIKVEPDNSDDIEVLGVELGTVTEEPQADCSQDSTETSGMNSSYNDQSGMNSSFDQSAMNSSYDQSFSIGDNSTGPNTSTGELSLSQAGATSVPVLPKRRVGRRKKIKPVLNLPKRPVGRPKKVKTDKEIEAELSSRTDCSAESKRRGKYSVFTPTLKEDILKEVEQNGLGVTARKYEIAKSTISTWKRDYNVNEPRTEKGRKIGSGRIPVHNNSVEEKVLAWISQQQERHIQPTQESIQEYARSLKQDDRPSIMGTAAWFRRFIDRNNISV